MTFQSRVSAYIRYNLILFPVIMAIYIPYNLLFIGYTTVQLTKWLLTSSLVSAGANLIIQPYISYCYHRKWLR